MRFLRIPPPTILLLVSSFALINISIKAQVITPSVSAWRLNDAGEKGRSECDGCETIHAVVSQIDADVQRARHNDTDVYINSTGVPSYPIGPWPDGNPTVATDRNWLFRIPKTPMEEIETKTEVPLGTIGVWVNGVAIFNAEDGHVDFDVWRQNAVTVEGGLLPGTDNGFDAALGHPAPVAGSMPEPPINGFDPGIYHHHQQSPSLRAQLGDDGGSHSPILGFAFDGFPVYGPYGFANPDGTGGVVRMESSYRLRSGERTPQPAPPGPFDGRYIDDFEYVSGLGDLDEHNGRNTVTPEYPDETYAYFATIDGDGNSVYPYAIGPEYYGVVARDNMNQTVSIPGNVVDYVPQNGVSSFAWLLFH